MGMSPIAQAVPRVAVFDVDETLSDLSGLVPRRTEVGAPPDLLPAWFAATLCDGFALTAAGCLADFAAIGNFTLASMLSDVDDLRETTEEAAEHVVSAMAQLDLHPDVAHAHRGRRSGRDPQQRRGRVAESLLERAGLRDRGAVPVGQ